MSFQNQGWTSLLKKEGADFLTWLMTERILSRNFDELATALSSLLRERVRTAEEASKVWCAAPAVLSQCDERGTYEKPGAACAYAWLHLLDRYVRTWFALELLVKKHRLPMGKNGVNALDVGTGPGPSAFAIHDFYASMIEFSWTRNNTKWRQPPHVTCVESARNKNHFRHHLAEKLFELSQQESKGVPAMCFNLPDFGRVEPSRERREHLEALRNSDETYFDEVTRQWTSEQMYLPDEANDIAQTQHRYRLITFSYFLTSVKTVKCYKPNLVDVLRDAKPGTVLLVLGAVSNHYPKVYRHVDRLAKQAGFDLVVRDQTVSCKNSEFACRVFEEGRQFYRFLQGLSPNNADETKEIRKEFEGQPPGKSPSSAVRAYRKHRYMKNDG